MANYYNQSICFLISLSLCALVSCGPLSVADSGREAATSEPTQMTSKTNATEVAGNTVGGDQSTATVSDSNVDTLHIGDNTTNTTNTNIINNTSNNVVENQTIIDNSKNEITNIENQTNIQGDHAENSASALQVQDIVPASGAVGATITIFGTGFGLDADAVSIQFNQAEAEILALTDTIITVKVPQGAISGPISVTKDGQTELSAEFEVLNSEPTA